MFKFIKSIFIKEVKLNELTTNELLARVEVNINRLTRLGGLEHAWNNEKSNAFKCYLLLVDLCEELCFTEKHGEEPYKLAMFRIRIAHPNFNY